MQEVIHQKHRFLIVATRLIRLTNYLLIFVVFMYYLQRFVVCNARELGGTTWCGYETANLPSSSISSQLIRYIAGPQSHGVDETKGRDVRQNRQRYLLIYLIDSVNITDFLLMNSVTEHSVMAH